MIHIDDKMVNEGVLYMKHSNPSLFVIRYVARTFSIEGVFTF